MDLPDIEASDAAKGESVLPPSHHGRVHEPETGHDFPPVNGRPGADDDECTCHRCADEDEPEPVECVECDGSGRSQITTKGHVVPINCPHCHGKGVVEP